ncbi:MAG: RusA family crossover junction endodeoxyribonuclease [Planctomycetota bacterium]
MIRLRFPFPPSVNHYWRHVGNRVLISRAGREYRSTVKSLMERDRIKPLDDELIVRIGLIPPDRRRRDIDNSLKALLDAMQAGGAYHDDSQIVMLCIEKRSPCKNEACAEVAIRHVPAELGKPGYRTCLRCNDEFYLTVPATVFASIVPVGACNSPRSELFGEPSITTDRGSHEAARLPTSRGECGLRTFANAR